MATIYDKTSPKTQCVQTQSPTVGYEVKGVAQGTESKVSGMLNRNFEPPFHDALLDVWALYHRPTCNPRDGISAPNPDSISHGLKWLQELYRQVEQTPHAWDQPHISTDENGDVVLEWWHESKKLTIYVTPTAIEYVKVWGLDIFNEMEDGSIMDYAQQRALWKWLQCS